MNVYTLIVLGLFCQLSSGRKNIAEEKTVLSHVRKPDGENLGSDMRDTSTALQGVNLGYALACYLKKTFNLKTAVGLIAKYGRYGCWCGKGGSGRTTDSLDACCKGHDKCLVEAGKRFGKGGWTFAVSAKVKTTLNCRKNEISCPGTGINKNACLCDKIFSSCVKRNKHVWKWWNALFFARRNCHE